MCNVQYRQRIDTTRKNTYKAVRKINNSISISNSRRKRNGQTEDSVTSLLTTATTIIANT